MTIPFYISCPLEYRNNRELGRDLIIMIKVCWKWIIVCDCPCNLIFHTPWMQLKEINKDLYIDSLGQDYSNCSVWAMELFKCCAMALIYRHMHIHIHVVIWSNGSVMLCIKLLICRLSIQQALAQKKVDLKALPYWPFIRNPLVMLDSPDKGWVMWQGVLCHDIIMIWQNFVILCIKELLCRSITPKPLFINIVYQFLELDVIIFTYYVPGAC